MKERERDTALLARKEKRERAGDKLMEEECEEEKRREMMIVPA